VLDVRRWAFFCPGRGELAQDEHAVVVHAACAVLLHYEIHSVLERRNESGCRILVFICVRLRLTITDQFAACRNVGREDLVDAGNHRPRPCLTRFAVVMNPVATSFPQDITREST
jgi:hypothetical protein